MTNVSKLTASNSDNWAKCSVTPARVKEVDAVSIRLCAVPAKAIYQQISSVTGVPWFVIAVIHEREASQSWTANIAQGDAFKLVSKHVPRGRGPFKTFNEAAIDALTKCAPFAARWKDWTAGGTLTLLELYNGTGYEDFHHEASPYNWGATNIEQWGKYVADGHWNAHVWDTQIGCAAMLIAMAKIDHSVKFL